MPIPITLVGAGLAGSLLAIYLARRGYFVDVYERRPDMRKVEIGGGRSINLALSTRGLHALREVGLLDDVMKVAIPMKGRMIHPLQGNPMLQPYGKDESEVIYATSRSLLNMTLLDAAEKYRTASLHFSQRCTGIDFPTGMLYLRDELLERENAVRYETVIGTDGSASSVRLQMQRSGMRFDFSQQYLEYGYKELTIPPGEGGMFRMEKNALHIWPRTTFMLIALPNMDGSFTCTFFYPLEGEESFETLGAEEEIESFFRHQFPDAAALMPNLIEEFFDNPTGTMVTIKCSPWHVGGGVLLLGDAAHAIVPFFGQGMNCAFEDCTNLNEAISRMSKRTGTLVFSTGTWRELFREYERMRKVDTDAIADLAVENFVEMRDHVARPDFQLRKKVERLLEQRFPERFVPKYSMVTFRRLPYSVAMARGKIQDRVLNELCSGLTDPREVDWEKARELIKRSLGPLGE
jgi:kynurenine 3-monooxygenase